MKLIRLHVENFGKLRDFSFEFTGNTNVILKDNGWGKSTLAAFISAMFYGFSGEHRKGSDNERRRYAPWQGGVFGGSLTFETAGKEYTVTRIFRDKEANDTFELRNAATGLPVKNASYQLGVQLFSIDKNSFNRTIFIGQTEDAKGGISDDISAKISNLTDNTGDLNNYEDAMQRLGSLINSMSPQRKTGSIFKMKDELTALNREVLETDALKASYENCRTYYENERERCEALSEKEKELTAKQSETVRLQAMAVKKEQLEGLVAAYDEAERAESEAKSRFPGDVPPLTEVQKEITCCQEQFRISSQVEMSEFSPEEKKTYLRLEPVFAGDPSPVRNARESSDLWNRRQSRMRNYLVKKSQLEALLKEKDPLDRKKTPVFIILSSILLVLGLMGVFYGYFSDVLILRIGIGVSSLGLILLILSIFLFIRKPSEEAVMKHRRKGILKLETEEAESAIADFDSEMEQYLLSHGAQFDEEMNAGTLQELMTGALQFEQLVTKEKSVDDRARVRLLELQAETGDFLSYYGYQESENMLGRMFEIQNDVRAYEAAAMKKAEAEQALEAFIAANDAKALENLDVSAIPSVEDIEREKQAVREEYDTASDYLRMYQDRMNALMEALEEKEGKRVQLEEKTEALNEMERRYRLLNRTKDFLSDSKEAMTSRYMEPLLRSFREYYQMLTGTDGSDLFLNADTEVSIEQEGMKRDPGSLSIGYQDLIGLCLRLALVDAMYTREKPFLILDDPFVNFDEQKTEAAREFLNRVSAKYQIIYFTCHSSRA